MLPPFSNEEIPLENLPKYEEVSFNPISSKLLYKSILQLSLLFLLLIVLSSFFLDDIFKIENFIVFGISLALLFFLLLFYIILRQKFYGYAIREKDILFKKGLIIKKTIIIPFNRIQHISISIPFLDKIFGISSLQIYTAGGSNSDMNIPGLLPDIANNLKDAISSKITKDD